MNDRNRTRGVLIVAVVSFIYGGLLAITNITVLIDIVSLARTAWGFRLDALTLFEVLVNWSIMIGMLAAGFTLLREDTRSLTIARAVWIVQLIAVMLSAMSRMRFSIDLVSLAVLIFLFFIVKKTDITGPLLNAEIDRQAASSHPSNPTVMTSSTLISPSITSDPLADLLPEEPVVQLKQAVESIYSGERLKAVEIVQELINTHPQSADVWYLAGYLHSDIDKKRFAYGKALSINPNHIKARTGLAQLR